MMKLTLNPLYCIVYRHTILLGHTNINHCCYYDVADLGLFSSKSLLEANPDHRVEIRDQSQQMPYTNMDRAERRVWLCESSRSRTTIVKYAEYQVNSFRRALELAKVLID